MEYTSYYNLNKPESTDAIDIGDINDNMDTLDTQMYKHETQLGNLYFGEDDNGKAGWKTSADGEVTPFRNPTGNATAARVLSGYVFSNASADDLTGSMNNWGSNTVTLSSSNTASLSAGYYSSVSINAAGRYSAGYNAGNSAGYSAKTVTITSLGTVTTNVVSNYSSSASWSAAGVSGYANLTSANFAITAATMYGYMAAGADTPYKTNSKSISLTYNASNGVLYTGAVGCYMSGTSNGTTYYLIFGLSSITAKCFSA